MSFSPRSTPEPAALAAERDGVTVSRSANEDAAAIEDREWLGRTRVVLLPTAAPSIMGLFGFFIATLMVGAWQAGWYGSPTTYRILWPFALMAGGVFQGIGAIASYRARDGLALAAHTVWGAFWLAWGTLMLLASVAVLPPIAFGTVNTSFAIWFVALTLVTMSCAFAAVGKSIGMVTVLGPLAAATALTAAGFYAGTGWLFTVGGWLFVVSAMAAWLVASSMMLEESTGRTIIPLGRWNKDANVPGRKATRPVGREAGMPGVRVGQ